MKSKKQKVETDDRAKIEYLRDENNKIKYYSYEIFKRNKPSLVGKLTREEMNSIYRLYSYYGASLTQRQISRFFPDLSLIDFKRILRAFNITKASSPFAPHMIEEKSQEELMEIQLREKENDFLRRIEEERIKNTEKLLNKYAEENLSLKENLKSIKKVKINLQGISTIKPTIKEKSNKDIILYLSDLHVGARYDGDLYKNYNDWNKEELNRRLDSTLERLVNLYEYYDSVTLVLLGDHLDGMDEMTSRRDHMLPQNMNNTEQVNVFIESIVRFITGLNTITNKINVYCVKCGNHAGDFEYVANLALMNVINSIYPEIKTKLFDTFFGYFNIKDHGFLICHGKDSKYMKRPMPLNLNDNTKIKIYEYLDVNNIHDNNIHIIKGDLHSENINSCDKFDYRNVLSLYGASDYCAMNYSMNQYGVSYDLFINDVFVRGTFENV